MIRVIIKYGYWLVNGLRLFIRKVIPTEIWLVLKSLLPGHAIHAVIGRINIKEWREAREKSPWHPDAREFNEGINLVGYFRTVKGISEAARSSALALDTVKIPYTVNDYEYGIPEWQLIDVIPNSQYRDGFEFNTNLIHVNPPQLPYLWSSFKKEKLTSRYNIGVWYWELPELPDEWEPAFGLVDEIWAASQFIFDSISVKASIPVVKIPPCISPLYNQQLKRSDYNLPNDRYLFLCAYDVLSTQARKNPIGAVDAFKRAFPKDDSSVGLVIKVNNAAENPREMRHLYSYINGYSNCYVIEEIFDKPRFNSLLSVVDVFVSLHRSEGFGLIPAEAMSFGKPVIMTRWSGNLDFMTSNNSCGVDYKLVPVSRQSGPYMPGQFWADPDVDHAAFFMQRLIDDRQYYAEISMQARKTIQDNFSPHQIGQLIKKRMMSVGLIS